MHLVGVGRISTIERLNFEFGLKDVFILLSCTTLEPGVVKEGRIAILKCSNVRE
jgi:hypothetical protein